MLTTADTARNIVNAMVLGSVPELERELRNATRFCGSIRSLSVYDAERTELLGAIAARMERSLRRFRARRSTQIDAAETDLYLLRHLAQSGLQNSVLTNSEGQGFR